MRTTRKTVGMLNYADFRRNALLHGRDDRSALYQHQMTVILQVLYQHQVTIILQVLYQHQHLLNLVNVIGRELRSTTSMLDKEAQMTDINKPEPGNPSHATATVADRSKILTPFAIA